MEREREGEEGERIHLLLETSVAPGDREGERDRETTPCFPPRISVVDNTDQC